jgi:hypothetical protein
MFDITTDNINHHIDVIWVNELDARYIPDVEDRNNTTLKNCINETYAG